VRRASFRPSSHVRLVSFKPNHRSLHMTKLSFPFWLILYPADNRTRTEGRHSWLWQPGFPCHLLIRHKSNSVLGVLGSPLSDPLFSEELSFGSIIRVLTPSTARSWNSAPDQTCAQELRLTFDTVDSYCVHDYRFALRL
jgi:hypothetical protein